ncbi:hydroxyphenylacetyl-CoA thioesterase PaaI [Aliiroseovarius sp. PrR006]|uniref:hydroxyphenylacetyl-CoA thioesterase PaaI n=1 Tax=Aliiroseovarius sp. PrR006 TaxID=2706883 RepID=UPI0013D2974E|nr:hydroxyphenylacetyl-CoA thioesterase PaaI [Aliiroseovarius sp. PrR006]NDW53363.1 hydroxyphenylacetyl-CoA thioesterase PaaI [Aliiroseovarius sp. PrR006]
MTPQEIAEKSADAMWADDPASQELGMRIDRIAPGEAALSMEIRKDMVNGHGICHGGFSYTLADSAFAFACNSYNQRAVAQHCQVSYLSPGKLGERLTATAIEISRAGRSGTYDVTVTGEDGRTVVLFRGHSRQIQGAHFDEQDG